ncbi:MAG: hypothetical protein MRY57_02015 [Candidatus Pacebacteria bacterium]|nr:hypothetical protein [Candidatus Paceibacterota bacterium]
MKKHLKKLRNKPDHEKTHIVRTMAIIVTALIFITYLLILAFSPDEETNQQEGQQNALESFNQILNAGIEQFGNIGSQIRDQRESIELTPENLELLNEAINQETNANTEAEVSSEDSSENQNGGENESSTNETNSETEITTSSESEEVQNNNEEDTASENQSQTN